MNADSKNEKNNMKEIFEEEFGCGIMSIVDGLYTYDHNDNKLIFWNSMFSIISKFFYYFSFLLLINKGHIHFNIHTHYFSIFNIIRLSHWVLINEKTGDVLL